MPLALARFLLVAAVVAFWAVAATADDGAYAASDKMGQIAFYCLLAAGIVIVLKAIFGKKKPPANPGEPTP